MRIRRYNVRRRLGVVPRNKTGDISKFDQFVGLCRDREGICEIGVTSRVRCDMPFCIWRHIDELIDARIFIRFSSV
jgi:hypothetical protein